MPRCKVSTVHAGFAQRPLSVFGIGPAPCLLASHTVMLMHVNLRFLPALGTAGPSSPADTVSINSGEQTPLNANNNLAC